MKKSKVFITNVAILKFVFDVIISQAQYTKLLDFNTTNVNGSQPLGLVSDGTYLYGMTYSGGANDKGIIFKIEPNGTNYVKLLDFNGINGSSPVAGSLIYDNTFLYGMTAYGGIHGKGNIFKIKFDGTDYLNLLDFNGTNGSYPYGSLIYSSSYLYGMADSGGTNNMGVIFKIKQDGTSYAKLFDFDSIHGSYPNGSLVYDSIFLYGMTSRGGTYKSGTVFKIKPDGTGYTDLLDFYGTNGSSPYGSLIFDSTFLYGMTTGGGISSVGTIFKIKQDGTNYTNLTDFDKINGSYPYGSLIHDNLFLYGITNSGGTDNYGVIFKIKPDGTGFTKLFDFTEYGLGIQPDGSPISDGTFLYGTASSGGGGFGGTLFKYYLHCDVNCCYSNYTTSYDTLQNIFTLTIDPATTNFASSYYWDFGDGSNSTQTTPTHEYTINTTYNVCLKIKTSSGDSCSYCHTIGKDALGNIYRTSGFTLKVVNASLQTGIIENNVLTNNISVYPNPTSGYLSLITNSEIGIVTISNVLGEKVYQSAITNQETYMDLSTQPNGVYFMSIKTNEGTVNKKIIISK